jgi:hypothetical protein
MNREFSAPVPVRREEGEDMEGYFMKRWTFLKQAGQERILHMTKQSKLEIVINL